jgi:hypothetical protein
LKMESREEVAKVWLTTAEMGFSLTDEEHRVVSPKDLLEGTITDRYLAPAITRFAIKVGNQEGHDPTLNPEERELRKEILALHQKWSKDCGELEDDDIKESAEMNAGAPQMFTRTIQRKNQRWEKDSGSRAEFDPVSFPTVMLRPMWAEISCFMKRSQNQRLNVGIFGSPRPRCGGSKGNFLGYGQQKDFHFAWKKGTSGQSIAAHGITSRHCGKVPP